jgi:hypothetical protein
MHPFGVQRNSQLERFVLTRRDARFPFCDTTSGLSLCPAYTIETRITSISNHSNTPFFIAEHADDFPHEVYVVCTLPACGPGRPENKNKPGQGHL